MKFAIGDSVCVRDGFIDEETDHPMGRWQGRIKEFYPEEQTALVAFDSVTLKAMPASYVERCEEEGCSWAEYGFSTDDLIKATVRDNASDVKRVFKEIASRHRYNYLGEEGRAIQSILADVDPDDEMEAFETWEAYLSQHVKLPVDAEVSEYQERGPLRGGDRIRIHSFEMVDDLYGIIVKVKRGRETFHFPLCDLEAIDQNSTEHDLIQLYAVWFANR